MKLVDTSVWIEFLRGRITWKGLADDLREGLVLIHPWVIGELAVGSLGPRRAAVLRDLRTLPAAPLVALDELLSLVEHHQLAGDGLGLVDVQLLASARLAGADLVTADRRLGAAWRRLDGSG